MKKPEQRWEFELFGDAKAPYLGGAVSLGIFDGVHRGHAHLVGELCREAQGKTKTAITFSPHPATVVSNVKVPLICTLEERVARLLELGIDAVVVQRFSPEFALLDATAFCREYLAACFKFSKVLLGFDFRFGSGRTGDAALLAVVGQEFGWEVSRSSPLLSEGLPVSSSRVRSSLLAGDVSAAKALLGRYFGMRGVVVRGDQRGRVLGFPTLNLAVPGDALVPKAGVYAGLVQLLATGATYKAVMSLGLRPTFGDGLEFRLEAHVLDFSQDIYGQMVEFIFVDRLRDEQKFSGPETLRFQMVKDVTEGRSRLAACLGSGDLSS